MRTELILDPERLSGVPVYTLLESAATGYLAADHRFLHAILDRGQAAVPDLVRFAGENREDDRVDLRPQLVDLFHVLRAPESIPFLIEMARLAPDDTSDDLIELFAAFGAQALDPLLALYAELGDKAGDIPFALAALGVHDPRILEILTRRLEDDTFEAAICLDVYADPAAIPALEAVVAKEPRVQPIIEFLQEKAKRETLAEETPEPFDIWDLYAEKDAPDFGELDPDEIQAFLDSVVPEWQIEALRFLAHDDLQPEVQKRAMELAKTSPDVKVRAVAWESLESLSDEPEVKRAMLAVLLDASAPAVERAGAAVALASQADNADVFNSIEQLYQDPDGRPGALKAMARSLDRRFSAYPPKHLDDSNPDLRRYAIWGVGFLNLTSEATRLEPFFEESRFRGDALFAYALTVPGETSRPLIRSLLAKVEKAAGGFADNEEEETVQMALDQRLILHGKKPVFFPDADGKSEDPQPLVLPEGKVGRNDPCPCGSGKKYKKCCGA